MVRQTFSRPGTYFVTVSEKSIVNPIIWPEYRYMAPTPVGSGVMISSSASTRQRRTTAVL